MDQTHHESKVERGSGLSVVYVVSDELAKVSAALPSNQGRSVAVHALVNKLGLLGGSSTQRVGGSESTPKRHAKPIRPRYATKKELCQYHDEEYIDYVLDPQNSGVSSSSTPNGAAATYGIEDDCPPFQMMCRYVPLVAGATLTAVEALVSGGADVAICWDGGRHHAQKSKASGFCYVADCVLSILTLRKPRITPNVSHAFHSDRRAKSNTTSQVLTFSIHHAAPGFFPISPLSSFPDSSVNSSDPFTISLPLRLGASPRTFAHIWKHVERARKTFDPMYVVVQCGTDGLAGDPCAVWNWSCGYEEGEMGWCVSRVLQWGCKVLLLGGGGYNTTNAARAWATLTSIAIGAPLSPDTQIPDHFAFPLYAPSFTLGVTAGNMLDTNDDGYLADVDIAMEKVLTELQGRSTFSS